MGSNIGKTIAKLCSEISCTLSCGHCFRFKFDNKDGEPAEHSPHHNTKNHITSGELTSSGSEEAGIAAHK